MNMKIWHIILKDSLLRFVDRSELLFFLILPVIFTFILSGSSGGSTERSITVLVADQDNTALSAEFAAALDEIGSLEVQTVTLAEAEEMYDDDEATAWVSLPQGFEASLLAGEATALQIERQPNNTDADACERGVRAAMSAVERPVQAALTSLAEAEALRPFATQQERDDYFALALADAQQAFSETPQRITLTRPAATDQQGYDPAAQASAGQMVTWVFIPLLAASGLFVYEREIKTFSRLLTTPTSKTTFLTGSILGQLLIGLVQMFILVGFGALFLKVGWARNAGPVTLVLVAFALASVALGVTMGTFLKTTKQASNLSIMLGMVMALLGGCWWPAELFPRALATAVHVLPTAWVMDGLVNVLMRGKGFDGVLLPSAVLLGFAVVFFAIGVRRFRYE
ncbi:MAG: ABC transporter permease [Anaerolineales bacterium]|nr:ABC transporter permease [Anaerolineales bacterium]